MQTLPIVFLQIVRFFRKRILATIIFFIGLSITLVVTAITKRQVENSSQLKFDRYSELVLDIIRNRLDIHKHNLSVMSAFFNASEKVSRNEWRMFVRDMKMNEYPGALGYGFIKYVPRKNLKEFLINTKRDGSPDFQLKTEGSEPDLFVIEFIEPYQENKPAVGFDIGSEKRRREAAVSSVYKNESVLSLKIPLLQDEKKVAGFLMLRSVFKNTNVKYSNPWDLVLGWTYSPIRIDELMSEIVETVEKKVDFVIFEDESNQKQNILYDSGGIFQNFQKENISESEYNQFSFSKELVLTHVGRTWKIRFVSTKEFEKEKNSNLFYFVFFAGVLISYLGAGLVAFSTLTKEKALFLADKMTIKLKKSESEARHALSELSNQKYALDEHAIVSITDKQGTITYVNDKFSKISKYSREELIGQNHRIINSGYHPKEFFQDLYKTVSSGNVWKAIIKNKAKDGSFYWVAATIVPFKNSEGQISEYVAIRANVTELKEIEEKLKIANFTKDKFFNMIAHDLKNPFNGILGLTELFLSEVNEGVTKEQQLEYLTSIQSVAKSTFQLLEDLLLWARAQGKQIRFQPENISFKTVLKDAVSPLSGSMIKKKIQIIYELAEDDLVYADAWMLNTIIRNLVTNGIKFTHSGGCIRIKTFLENDFFRIEIQDNGIGIEKKNIEKLFRIDERFQNTGTDKETGTGLGLLVCKEFVEKHGGSIWVESEFGKGSHFIFTIPVVKAVFP